MQVARAAWRSGDPRAGGAVGGGSEGGPRRGRGHHGASAAPRPSTTRSADGDGSGGRLSRPAADSSSSTRGNSDASDGVSVSWSMASSSRSSSGPARLSAWLAPWLMTAFRTTCVTGFRTQQLTDIVRKADVMVKVSGSRTLYLMLVHHDRQVGSCMRMGLSNEAGRGDDVVRRQYRCLLGRATCEPDRVPHQDGRAPGSTPRGLRHWRRRYRRGRHARCPAVQDATQVVEALNEMEETNI